jgi:hypothetical protein
MISTAANVSIKVFTVRAGKNLSHLELLLGKVRDSDNIHPSAFRPREEFLTMSNKRQKTCGDLNAAPLSAYELEITVRQMVESMEVVDVHTVSRLCNIYEDLQSH